MRRPDKDEVASLLDVLRDNPDGAVRGSALERLAHLDDESACGALFLSLRETHLWAFEVAAEAVAQRGGAESVRALTEALDERLRRGETYFVRTAAEALAKTGDPLAIPHIVRALASPDSWERQKLAEALTRFGPAAVEPLVESLGDENPFIRDGSVLALSGVNPPPVERLLRTLEEDSAHRRGGAAAVLGNLGEAAPDGPLVRALGDPEPEVAAAAAAALGKLARPAAVEHLIGRTRHDDARVRVAAAQALGGCRDVRAVEPLVALLDDTESGVDRGAQESLVMIGEPAVAPLAAKFRAAGGGARRLAAETLSRLGGRALVTLFDAVRDPAPDLRAAAAAALGVFRHEYPIDYTEPPKDLPSHEEVVKHLLLCLGDPDFRVRRAALGSLAKIYQGVLFLFRRGDLSMGHIIGPVFALATKKGEPARVRAVETLLRLDDAGEYLTSLVVRGVEHEDDAVSIDFLNGLAKLLSEPGGDFPGWLSVMKDFYHLMISPSVDLITSALVRRTRHDNERVREAAVRALSALRARLKAKRLHGRSDIHYSWDGPLPKSELGAEVKQERAISAALLEAAPQVPQQRYADFIFYDGAAGAIPDGHALQAEHWYELEVAVRAEPTGIRPEGGERRPLREPGQGAALTIMVALEADGFEVKEPVQTLVLPPAGDSTHNARFGVRPLRKSATADSLARVRVRLYYEFNLLEVAVISAEVVGKFDDPAHSQLGLPSPVTFRQERQERDYLDLENVLPRDMHVDISAEGGHYLFNFAFRNDRSNAVVFSAPARLPKEDLEDDLLALRKVWYQIALSKTFSSRVDGDDDEFLSQVRSLAAAGRRLWIKLFKRESGSALYKVGRWLEGHPLRPGSTIQISADGDAAGFVFPWSLLYDRPVPRQNYVLPVTDGFWGARYCIEQHLPNLKLGPDSALDAGGELKMGFMLWEQFRNAAQQKELLAELARRSGGKLVVSEPPVSDADECFRLLGEGDADVLYFYTHGYTRHRQADVGVGQNFELFLRQYERLDADSPLRETYKLLYESIKQNRFEPDRSWIELTYGRLYLDELYDCIDQLPSRPLVILNMCESAQVTPSLSDSFIHFFLDRRARAVIGTECPMTVEFAHPFAETFLKGLLSGGTAGTVLLDIRRSFLKRKNPLGLAYTLFGSSTLRVAPPVLA